MAPKKNKNKNKGGAGGGTPDDDFDDLLKEEAIKSAADLTMIRNLFVGVVFKCDKVPNSQFTKCEIELPGEEEDLFVVTTAKVEEDMKVIVAKAPCQLPNGIAV